MKYRKRIYYTEEQRSLMWDRWQKGESLRSIAQLFDRGHSSIGGILKESGGIRPQPRRRSRRRPTPPTLRSNARCHDRRPTRSSFGQTQRWPLCMSPMNTPKKWSRGLVSTYPQHAAAQQTSATCIPTTLRSAHRPPTRPSGNAWTRSSSRTSIASTPRAASRLVRSSRIHH